MDIAGRNIYIYKVTQKAQKSQKGILQPQYQESVELVKFVKFVVEIKNSVVSFKLSL